MARFARATFNESATSVRVGQNTRAEDDELRRIIEELHNSKQKSKADENKTNSSENNLKISEEIRQASVLLGLSGNATLEELNAAYRRKIMETHPDKFAGQSPEIQEKARVKSVEVNAAYQLLRQMKGA